MEAAGAFSVVLESVPREVAARITGKLRIPTIGIGAGPDCDGQMLVFHDLLGLTTGHVPKFVRQYANLSGEISRAVSNIMKMFARDDFPRMRSRTIRPRKHGNTRRLANVRDLAMQYGVSRFQSEGRPLA